MKVRNDRDQDLTALGVTIAPGQSETVKGLQNDHIFIRAGWLKPVTGEASGADDQIDLFKPKHLGGGKWVVEGPDGVVPDFSGKKPEAIAHAAQLNADAKVETR